MLSLRKRNYDFDGVWDSLDMCSQRHIGRLRNWRHDFSRVLIVDDKKLALKLKDEILNGFQYI